MIACQSRRRRTAFLFLAWLAPAFIAGPPLALSQSNNQSGPIKLYKRKLKDQREQENAPKPEQSEKKDPGGIAIKSLGKVDLSAVGSMGPDNGGFSPDMWKGSRRVVLDSLIPQLPIRHGSATLRGLQRRLLLSAGAVPKGRDRGPSLLALRLEKLSESGWLEDVVELARLVPNDLTDETLAKAQRDSLLLIGDDEAACQVVDQFAVKQPDLDWQKSAAYCAAVRGDSARFDISMSLLRERGLDDPQFEALVSELHFGERTKRRNVTVRDALDIALLRVTNRALPGTGDNQATPREQRALAASNNTKPSTRLLAAVNAEASGALPTRKLRELMLGVGFTEPQRNDPTGYADKAPPAMARTLFYQAAATAADPDSKARLMMEAFDDGHAREALPDVVRLHQSNLNSLQPAPSLRWFSPIALRAALLNGDFKRIRAWNGLLTSDAANRGGDRALAPLVYLAGMRTGKYGANAIVNQWWLDQAADGDESRFTRAGYLAAMYRALGLKVPDTLWRALLAAPPNAATVSVSPGLRHAIDTASAGKRLGETVLLSLIAAGEKRAQDLDPDSLAVIVRGLHRVGLKAEARRLALEALLGLGL